MAYEPGIGNRFLLPAGERESFFAAQRRHRRVAFRYGVLATVAVLLQALPATVMLAPILGAAVLLGSDLVNLAVPTPDLFAWLRPLLDGADHADQVWAARPWAGTALPLPDLPPWAGLLVLALLPGLLYMIGIWWWVLVAFLRNGIGGLVTDLGVRPPDRSDAEEHELANVVEEMALAAGVAAPTLLLTDAELNNAAAFGRSPDEATIVVSRRMLDRLDRSETQGGIGHLIGSVGNGDLRILNMVLAVFVTYALAPALLTPLLRRSRRQLRAVLRAMRQRDDPREEARAVRELLASEDGPGVVSSLIFITWTLSNWMGNLIFVGPLLLAPFRTRRYLADATAVQLTRDGDALGRALAGLRGADPAVPAPARYAAPHFLLEPNGGDDLGSDVGLAVSFHPSIDKRLKRLRRLGYRGPDPGRRRLTAGRVLALAFAYTIFAVVVVPLLAAIVVLALTLVELCVMLALLFMLFFFLLVVAPLHLWLRSLA